MFFAKLMVDDSQTTAADCLKMERISENQFNPYHPYSNFS